METLGSRLRAFRTYRKMTQFELGRGICSASAISQFERDVHCPTLETLGLLAERLQFPLERLMFGEEFQRLQQQTFTAIHFYEDEQFDDAAIMFEEIVQSPQLPLMPLKGHILLSLGICYLEQKKFDAAILTLSKIVDDTPETGGMYVTDNLLVSDAYLALSKAFEGRALGKALERRAICTDTPTEVMTTPRPHLYLVKG